VEELAEAMLLTTDQIRRALDAPMVTASLDDPLHDGLGEGLTVSDTVADGRPSVLTEIIHADRNQRFRGVLDDFVERLDSWEREIWQARHVEGLSYQRIADRVGTTRETARKRIIRMEEELRGLVLG
jgi:RNA polymerase sigma factor (sigma-70 family)